MRAWVGARPWAGAWALVWVCFGVGVVVGACVCVRLMRARALVHLGVGLVLDAWCGVGCGQVCGRVVLGFFFFRDFFFEKKVFSFACLGAGAWARVCVCGLGAAFFLKRKCFSFFFC